MRFLKKNNMPHTTVHSFRHFYASALIHSGVDIVTVSKSLGHANVTTKGNVYAHAIRSADETATDKLEETLGRRRGERRTLFKCTLGLPLACSTINRIFFTIWQETFVK